MEYIFLFSISLHSHPSLATQHIFVGRLNLLNNSLSCLKNMTFTWAFWDRLSFFSVIIYCISSSGLCFLKQENQIWLNTKYLVSKFIFKKNYKTKNIKMYLYSRCSNITENKIPMNIAQYLSYLRLFLIILKLKSQHPI